MFRNDPGSVLVRIRQFSPHVFDPRITDITRRLLDPPGRADHRSPRVRKWRVLQQSRYFRLAVEFLAKRQL